MPEESNIAIGTAADLGAAGSNSPAPAQPSGNSDGELDLSSAIRQEMQSRFSSAKPAIDNNLPDGLVSGAAPQPKNPDANDQINALQGDKPEGEEKKPEPEQAPEEQQSTSQREDGREEITAIHLERFGRDYSLAEVEAAIEGFNYYHPKALKFQEDLQRFQNEKQQFEQLKSSPDMQLVNMLKSDPGLKQKFLQVAREHSPQKMQAHQENQEVSALKAEIDQLKNVLNQNQKKLQADEAQQKQQAWQTHVVNTTRAVDQAVTQKLESLKSQGVEITQPELEIISQNAIGLVQSGRMKYDAQTVTAYFGQMIDMIAGKALKARQVGIQNYQETKRGLPPAPPSGGAAPIMQPDAPKNFTDMQSVMANRLESVLKQI